MESHVRIDDGLKRGKRQMRQDARKQPKSKNGTFLSSIDPEKRSSIILEAPERILKGETTTQIAQSYNIPPSTLRAWLIGNQDAEAARGAMLAQELMIRAEDIDNATDPLSLAQAREGFKAWSWLAERRESRLYGMKSETKIDIDYHVTVDASLSESARLLLDQVRVVEVRHDAAQQEGIIDVVPAQQIMGSK